MAYCPSCTREVAPASLTCMHCGAAFGTDAAWRPLPEPPEATPTHSRVVLVIVLMAIVYIVLVRGIFGWLWDVSRGDSFFFAAIYSHFRVFQIESISLLAKMLAPYIVVAACVIGLLNKWRWAWWLTIAACSHDLVYSLISAPRNLTMGGTFAISTSVRTIWLLVMVGLLLVAYRAGEFAAKGRPATSERGG